MTKPEANRRSKVVDKTSQRRFSLERLLAPGISLLLLSGCGRSEFEWEGILFPSWLVAFALAVPFAVVVGMPVQRYLAPDHRWTREPLELCFLAIFFVAFYFLLTAPGASSP